MAERMGYHLLLETLPAGLSFTGSLSIYYCIAHIGRRKQWPQLFGLFTYAGTIRCNIFSAKH